jgi:hypothetical protein
MFNSGGTVGNSVFYGGPCRRFMRRAVGRELPFREDLSPEAATVRSCYQAATSEDSVAGKDLGCALVICKVWKLVMVL